MKHGRDGGLFSRTKERKKAKKEKGREGKGEEKWAIGDWGLVERRDLAERANQFWDVYSFGSGLGVFFLLVWRRGLRL